MKRLCLALCILAFVTAAQAQTVIESITGASVSIINDDDGQGSGVVINRVVGDDTISFVWTAAHVVKGLLKDGKFADTSVRYENVHLGRPVSYARYDAKVIRYSDAVGGDDLALLRILEPNTGRDSAISFYLDDEIPTIGTEVYHVGSIYGQHFHGSLSNGIISYVGRLLPRPGGKAIFDQTTAVVFPGCSGGGVFLRDDGRYVGMTVLLAGPNVSLMVPVRRMRSFAQRMNVEWALYPTIPVPADSDTVLIEHHKPSVFQLVIPKVKDLLSPVQPHEGYFRHPFNPVPSEPGL